MARGTTGSSALCPEERRVTRHKVTDAGRRPAGDRLDIVCKAIIAVGGMEAGHGQQVLEDMLRQLAAAQLLVPPLLQGHIHIPDGAPSAAAYSAASACRSCDRGPVSS